MRTRVRAAPLVFAALAAAAAVTGSLAFTETSTERAVSVAAVEPEHALVGVTACAVGPGQSAAVVVRVTNRGAAEFEVTAVRSDGGTVRGPLAPNGSTSVGPGESTVAVQRFAVPVTTVDVVVDGGGTSATVTASVVQSTGAECRGGGGSPGQGTAD